MQCPIDGSILALSDRQGIEIDFDHCPQCRGVGLDRGELDKIIARENAEAVPAGRSRRGHDNDLDNSRRQHKRKGFLSDLFEFGD